MWQLPHQNSCSKSLAYLKQYNLASLKKPLWMRQKKSMICFKKTQNTIYMRSWKISQHRQANQRIGWNLDFFTKSGTGWWNTNKDNGNNWGLRQYRNWLGIKQSNSKLRNLQRHFISNSLKFRTTPEHQTAIHIMFRKKQTYSGRLKVFYFRQWFKSSQICKVRLLIR